MVKDEQKVLCPEQLAKFFHDEFVSSQIEDFTKLIIAKNPSPGVIVDVGGGCGNFAKALKDAFELEVRVVDLDPLSVETCKDKGIDGRIGNALWPPVSGDEGVICLNLVLHHLVADSDSETRLLQEKALNFWNNRPVLIFVNEYTYESFINGFSPWLIFRVTHSRIFSFFARQISRFVPSLHANTFGTGVRFRSHKDWMSLFASAGYQVIGYSIGRSEHVSIPRRALLIKRCCRNSYVLKPSND